MMLNVSGCPNLMIIPEKIVKIYDTFRKSKSVIIDIVEISYERVFTNERPNCKMVAILSIDQKRNRAT